MWCPYRGGLDNVTQRGWQSEGELPQKGLLFITLNLNLVSLEGANLTSTPTNELWEETPEKG